MRCGIPIVSANTSCLPEIAGDAAIYCDPFSVKDITAQLHTLSNDSTLHEKLTEHALTRSALFSWDKAAEEVWDVLNEK
jgi:glycosyltransferase involved in cell wall biosynthesis